MDNIKRLSQLNEIPEYREGIYFLLEDNEIVYIGQSENLSKRIKTHILSDKIFDSFKIKFMPFSTIEERCEKEMKYISTFNPKYNKTHNYYNYYINEYRLIECRKLIEKIDGAINGNKNFEKWNYISNFLGISLLELKLLIQLCENAYYSFKNSQGVQSIKCI